MPDARHGQPEVPISTMRAGNVTERVPRVGES
jgi:hypothetical protein